MPREFDSDAVARGEQSLVFVENVDCPACNHTFEGTFTDPSMSVEDIVDPPAGWHTCPACGRQWNSHLTGWMVYGEAG